MKHILLISTIVAFIFMIFNFMYGNISIGTILLINVTTGIILLKQEKW